MTRSCLTLIALSLALLHALLLPAFSAAAVHRYHVTVEAALSQVSVRARVGLGQSLRARDGRAAEMAALATCDGSTVGMRRGRIVLPASADCVQYEYSLLARAQEQSAPLRRPEVAQGTVVTTPSQWLWLPDLEVDDEVLITLSLPPGAAASVPWRSLPDGTFALPASPRSSHAAAVFGDFHAHTVTVPGGELRVALVDGPRVSLTDASNTTKVLSWLEAAARDVAAVSGEFPNPAPQIIVQPGPSLSWRPSRSPVPFGYVIRDGGEAIRFFVDVSRPLEDFLGDWTASHEFSHLLLPYVRSQEKWISEGFASYYQNVLLARRGIYSEREAWQRLHRSFRRAGDIPNPPALQDIDQRPFWEVRMLVYWGGAAIALLADAQLRQASDGQDSLDAVLGRLQRCCLPSTRVWRGRELFAKLDELSTRPVFLKLFERYATARGMPDLQSLYADLGVVVDASDRSTVSLAEGAPLAGVRRGIMTPSQ